MQIVDRYLESVKDCLPKTEADDIIKELSENISSQIEDKEGELARPLTDSPAACGQPLSPGAAQCLFWPPDYWSDVVPLLYPSAEVQPGINQRDPNCDLRRVVCQRPANRKSPTGLPLSAADSVCDRNADLFSDGQTLCQVSGFLGSTKAIRSAPSRTACT